MKFTLIDILFLHYLTAYMKNAVIKTFLLPILLTIESDTYKNGIDITAPVVMVKPNKYMGAPISSLSNRNRKVSTNPKQFPRIEFE